jgi:hypothetical protein
VSRRPLTYKIAATVDRTPGSLLVVRDPKISGVTIWLRSANGLPCAAELSPEAHADLLQALSIPPSVGPVKG